MLSWFSKKIFQFKKRKENLRALSKWHKACLWLAHSVGGIDMLLRDDGTILVISKASCDPETLVDGIVSRSNGGTLRRYLRVDMLSKMSKNSELKTIDQWNVDLAKFVVSLISFSEESDPNLDPPEGKWGVMLSTQVNANGLMSTSEFLFPTFKNEEELFMRMTLDGFDINDKDSSNA